MITFFSVVNVHSTMLRFECKQQKNLRQIEGFVLEHSVGFPVWMEFSVRSPMSLKHLVSSLMSLKHSVILFLIVGSYKYSVSFTVFFKHSVSFPVSLEHCGNPPIFSKCSYVLKHFPFPGIFETFSHFFSVFRTFSPYL